LYKLGQIDWHTRQEAGTSQCSDKQF
jgi:hypothetical protein